MEPVLVLLSLGLLAGAGLWHSFQGSRNRLKSWQDVAKSCGLESVETSTFFRSSLTARAGRVTVWIEAASDEKQSNRITIVIPGPPDFYMVRLLPESHFQAREIEIGDRTFDDTFFIQGPVPLVLALLDAETRRLLLRVNLKNPIEMSDGGLRANVADEKIPSVLPLLLDVGQRFAQPVDIPQRLSENAHQDPEAGVRLQNLLLLIRELPRIRARSRCSARPALTRASKSGCGPPRRWAPKVTVSSWRSRRAWWTTSCARKPYRSWAGSCPSSAQKSSSTVRGECAASRRPAPAWRCSAVAEPPKPSACWRR